MAYKKTPFKMKGHTLPGIKQRKSSKKADGRASSSPLQYRLAGEGNVIKKNTEAGRKYVKETKGNKYEYKGNYYDTRAEWQAAINADKNKSTTEGGNKKSPVQMKLPKNRGSKQFQKTGVRKKVRDTAVGKAITDITGSIFGSKKNPKYKGKGRSLLGSLTHSRRKSKAKRGKPTKSDGMGTAIGGQEGVTIKG